MDPFSGYFQEMLVPTGFHVLVCLEDVPIVLDTVIGFGREWREIFGWTAAA